MRPGAKEGTFSQVPRGVFVGHRPPGTPVAPCSDKKFYIWFTQTMRQYSWSMSASRICLLEFLVWQNRKTLKKISKGARAHTQTHIQQKHRRTDAAGRPSKPSSRESCQWTIHAVFDVYLWCIHQLDSAALSLLQVQSNHWDSKSLDQQPLRHAVCKDSRIPLDSWQKPCVTLNKHRATCHQNCGNSYERAQCSLNGQTAVSLWNLWKLSGLNTELRPPSLRCTAQIYWASDCSRCPALSFLRHMHLLHRSTQLFFEHFWTLNSYELVVA